LLPWPHLYFSVLYFFAGVAVLAVLQGLPDKQLIFQRRQVEIKKS
jgi:hypothetical protein